MTLRATDKIAEPSSHYSTGRQSGSCLQNVVAVLSDDELKSVLGDKPVTVLCYPSDCEPHRLLVHRFRRHMYGTPIKSSGAAAAMTDRS